MKFRMPQEGLSLVGERVDPALALEKQVYVPSRSAEAVRFCPRAVLLGFNQIKRFTCFCI